MFYEFIPLDHSHEEQPKVKYCLVLFTQFLNIQQHIWEGRSDYLKERSRQWGGGGGNFKKN